MNSHSISPIIGERNKSGFDLLTSVSVHLLHDISVHDIPRAPHPTCATSHMRHIPRVEHPISAISHVREVIFFARSPTARNPIARNSVRAIFPSTPLFEVDQLLNQSTNKRTNVAHKCCALNVAHVEWRVRKTFFLKLTK